MKHFVEPLVNGWVTFGGSVLPRAVRNQGSRSKANAQSDGQRSVVTTVPPKPIVSRVREVLEDEPSVLQTSLQAHRDVSELERRLARLKEVLPEVAERVEMNGELSGRSSGLKSVERQRVVLEGLEFRPRPLWGWRRKRHG